MGMFFDQRTREAPERPEDPAGRPQTKRTPVLALYVKV